MAELLSTVEFQMSLLLFVSLAGYLIASRINQSAVIGEILVGLAIGPSILGLITYTDFVKSVAHLGAVILLFVVGLEFKLKDIFNLKYGIIAAVGVIVPWIGGYFTAKLFGYDFTTAVFVGTALTATSIAITANVLKELGKLQTEAAKAIIGAAVIDDVLSLLALSVAQQLAAGSISAAATGIVVLKSLAFLIAGAILGQLVLNRLVVRMDRSAIARKYPEFVFIFAMSMAFLYAMGAELIGLSAIVGAFIAGVALEGVVPQHSKPFKEGAEYLHIIFAATFFVSLGILADFRAVTPAVILFLAVLTVVAVLTKLIGCYLPARMQKMSHDDSLVVGFGMSPRGEVAMIVALLALNSGLIMQDIYVTIVMMSVLTTLLTPIVLRNWLYSRVHV
ncbi:cation:proton antiporter [Candidatus Woesearchaeota archaeon]|nr:cation:proton antiporter [Candidatus Woesearchaeota archaeon]